MVLRWKGGGPVATKSMENLVFLLSYSPCPLFSSLFWLYFGFLIGISYLHCIGTMQESCVLSFRAWVSGGTKGNQSSLTKYMGN